jgi:hypothetical protein
MRIPFELIQIIYNYSDIDTKQSFNKIFNHTSFIHNKLLLPSSAEILLNQVISFKFTNYSVIKELYHTFLFL